MQYHIWTIGCQMNVADSQRVAAGLERLGYTPSLKAEEADVIVLNTCVIRQQPENKAVGRLHQLRKLKERYPNRVLALMGCMVGVKETESLIKRFPWVDLFLPPSDPTELWSYLASHEELDEVETLIADAETRRLAVGRADTILPKSQEGEVISAYVPIVLGCSHACTYCVIPYRRGVERSRPMEAILAEVHQLVTQGVREITLLGQIVDRYGYDLPEFQDVAQTPLVTLLEKVHAINGLVRIRFLTSHPNWMKDDLLQTVATLPKLCPHIELPVQAGDDNILKLMRRGYTSDDYRQLVGRIRALIPGVSIATDIIVGFPGETEDQFQNTYNLLKELQLDKAHIARYSARPRTVATRRMEDNLSYEVKEQRRKTLDEMQSAVVTDLNSHYLDEVVEVLVEGKHERNNRWFGRTVTDRLVFFESDDPWFGKLARVKITWAGPWSLIGEPCNTPASQIKHP